MSQDALPEDHAVLTMTFAQLVVCEDVLAEKCAEAFRQAVQERVTTGRVSVALADRLTKTQAMHAEVVEALQLKRIEDENRGPA